MLSQQSSQHPPPDRDDLRAINDESATQLKKALEVRPWCVGVWVCGGRGGGCVYVWLWVCGCVCMCGCGCVCVWGVVSVGAEVVVCVGGGGRCEVRSSNFKMQTIDLST